jgi:hypothetical protein
LEVFLNNSIRGRYNEIDFLNSEGSILINLDWTVEKVIYVAIRCENPEFIFMISQQDGDIVFQRNETITIHTAKEHVGKTVWIGVVWSPEVLKTIFRSGKEVETLKSIPVNTKFTLPPSEVVIYARENNQIPKSNFESENKFVEQVHKLIQTSQIKINQTGSHIAFWNTIKQGAKIIDRKPKDETELHSILFSHFFDFCLKNGITVRQEVQRPIGNIDFLFEAIVNDKILSVPCEVKKNHSPDLEHGLKMQLPTYMKHIGSNFGVYLILSFSGDKWKKGPTLSDSIISLSKLNKNINIRLIGIDLSKPIQASKKK